MKKYIVLLLISSLINSLQADPKYPVSAIAEEMKKNVNAIYREDKMSFQIHSKNRATLHVIQAITILNTKAKEHGSMVVPYDKLTKITEFRGTLYDANGEIIRKLKNNEIYDQSAYSGELFGDDRLKAADLTHGTYPYTVEFEYEIEYKYLFIIPGFSVDANEETSVEHAEYMLTFPADLKPNFLALNTTVEPTRQSNEGKESVRWEFKQVMSFKHEAFGPRPSDLAIQIIAAPSKFKYEEYEGTMENWDQLGQWIRSLNTGRNVLPDATKQKLLSLTSNLKTTEEKVKAIYEYMQGRTRYVSIQLGIGGFQPFEAAVVDKTGYGDCKALSNYMVSMLEVVGIPSNYVLIKAGDNASRLRTNFPSSQFNHAVVCVPLAKDTLWLECTSQTNPFGYMGSFTGNRKALAITNSGAKIVRTPVYTEKENTQIRSAEVVLTLQGEAKAKIKTVYSGLQYENDDLHFILNDQFDEQKKWIEENTSIPSFNLNTFNIVNKKGRIPSAIISMDLTIPRSASVSGKRLFLTANLMNRSTFIPEKVENRVSPVIKKMAYVDFDSIHYQIPQEIYPEFLPNPVKIESIFGTYEATFKVDEKGLLYIRKLYMKAGEFPAEKYNDLIEFHKGINKADNTKIVFLTKT